MSLTRGLDYTLSEEVREHTVMYVDDCLCISRGIEEYLIHLEKLLINLKNQDLTINLKKKQASLGKNLVPRICARNKGNITLRKQDKSDQKFSKIQEQKTAQGTLRIN